MSQAKRVGSDPNQFVIDPAPVCGTGDRVGALAELQFVGLRRCSGVAAA